MAVKTLSRLDAAIAAEKAARETLDLAQARTAELRGKSAGIARELAAQRAALSSLAEDADRFRQALAVISAEEDREKAINGILIPEAEAAETAGEEWLERAVIERATARAIKGAQMIRDADLNFELALSALSAALAECDRVRGEHRAAIYDRSSGLKSDFMGIKFLLGFLPENLARWILSTDRDSLGWRRGDSISRMYVEHFQIPAED
jgi:hypothetical protein